MAPEILIRPARPEEAVALGVLTERVYREGGFSTESYSRELLDGVTRVRDALVLVALVDEALVASVTVAEPGTAYSEISGDDELEVRMLAVDEAARGQGIADLLMDSIEAHAREVGLAAVVLSTEPEMHTAHRLYERRGYVRCPDRDWHVDGFDLMVYRRSLDEAPSIPS